MIYSLATISGLLFARAGNAAEARAIFARSLRAQRLSPEQRIRVSVRDVAQYCADFENRTPAPSLKFAIAKIEVRGCENFGAAPRYHQVSNDRLAQSRATVSIRL